MKITKHKMLWRWIALVSILINFLFNYVSEGLNIGIGTTAEITAIYRHYFTPAGYAFSIWGIIYLLFGTHAIFQLLPSQHKEHLHDRIVLPFTLINILSIAWQIAYRSNYITVSLLLILSMLFLGFRAYTSAKVSQLQHRRSYLYTIPFSLFLGWITIASIANTATWIIYLGYETSANMATTMAAISLLAAFIIGITISVRYRDFIFPFIIAWGTIGIWYKFSFINAIVAGVALFTGVVLVVSGFFSVIWHFRLRYIYQDKPVRIYNEI